MSSTLPVPPRRRRARRILVALAVLVAVTAVPVYRSVARSDYAGAGGGVSVDLRRPDALVRTRSLSQLPRDLLRVPLLRDLLSEDFVFYYDDDPDRLGVEGSLRRIAYEHDLRWTDSVVRWVLDQPAEVALWRAKDGRLRHWLIAMTRSELARALEGLATAALPDRQLTHAGTLMVDGAPRQVLAFEYSATRTLLVVAAGDRVAILSDPGLLLDDERQPVAESAAVVGELLSADAGRRLVYDRAFELAPAAEHSVLVGMAYASFGYQRYFPGVEALRFDFGADGWSTHALLDGAHLPASALKPGLWTALPTHPALCAWLPAEWTQAQQLPGGPPSLQKGLAARLEGPAAVCWYASGLLQAPLFVAAFESLPNDVEPLLDELFTWAIAGRNPATPVRKSRIAGKGAKWQRSVTVPFAKLDTEGEPEPGPLDVTLARHGRFVLFSPDSALVHRAISTLDKRYPSVADTLAATGVTLAVVSPSQLALMAKRDALGMLPRESEPLFRGAAERLLLPRLAKMERYPALRLALPEGPPPERREWRPVQWQELAP